ncbi:MAG: hypothetical protein ACKOGD_04175, partial [Sphingomonadales bacterium]
MITTSCCIGNGCTIASTCIDKNRRTSSIVCPVLVSVQALPSSNITASGSLTFCEGGSVLLSADPATSYAWSNGQTTQSITVAQTANITLITSNGVCTATSAPVA